MHEGFRSTFGHVSLGYNPMKYTPQQYNYSTTVLGPSACPRASTEPLALATTLLPATSTRMLGAAGGFCGRRSVAQAVHVSSRCVSRPQLAHMASASAQLHQAPPGAPSVAGPGQVLLHCSKRRGV